MKSIHDWKAQRFVESILDAVVSEDGVSQSALDQIMGGEASAEVPSRVKTLIQHIVKYLQIQGKSDQEISNGVNAAVLQALVPEGPQRQRMGKTDILGLQRRLGAEAEGEE
jgi:hypothetical protein